MKSGLVMTSGLLILGMISSAAAADSGVALREQVTQGLDAVRADLIEVHRDLHRHPELAGEEERTASVVAGRLRALGLEVYTGVGGHGVVAILKGGRPGPVVGYRADMDAVRSDAPDPVPYASKTPGVRHICGHDIHTTVALGIAEALAPLRSEIRGTIKFLFQPAEENGQGARAMLADGAMSDPRPQAVFAVHSYPAPAGSMAAGIGQTLPGRDTFRIALSGEGDLEGAARSLAELISRLTTLDVAAAAAGMLVEGDFVLAQVLHSGPGEADDQWMLMGQITAGSRESASKAEETLGRTLEELDFEGVSPELAYRAESLSGIHNDPALVETTGSLIRSLVGEDGFSTSRGILPFFSEDFGFFQAESPGVMYWLGVANPQEGIVGLPHSPDFVADEDAIFVGAEVMSVVLLDYLGY